MTNKQVTYINPPSVCDVCEENLQLVFYDCRTVFGSWANLCPKCWLKFRASPKLGTGNCQKYKKDVVTREFVKVAG